MRLSHSSLIKLIQDCGYPALSVGICRGFSGMLTQASFCSDKANFYARLNFLTQYLDSAPLLIHAIEKAQEKHKQDLILTDEEKMLLEIPPFFEGIMLYMYPVKYKAFTNLRHFTQMNLSQIFVLTRPASLENVNIFVYLNKIYGADKQQLQRYLNSLAAILLAGIKKEVFFPVNFQFSTLEHTVWVEYSGQGWVFVDTNTMANETQEAYEVVLDTPQLVDALFKAFGEDNCLLFRTEVTTPVWSQEFNEDCLAFDKAFPLPLEKNTLVKNKAGGTLLHFACQQGDLTIAQALLKAYPKAINDVSELWPPLHLACIAGNIRLVELLLAHGANPLARGQHEKIPLQIACRHGHEDIVTLLLDEKSSHMVDAGENTLLHYACSSGDSSLMKRVLQAGVSPNKVNVLGETPLHWAVEDNLQELIVLLLDAGANIEQPDARGVTPFSWICMAKPTPITTVIIDTFIKHGANPFLRSEQGVFPLYLACQYGNFEAVKRCLQVEGNINLEGIDNHTSLMVACLSAETYFATGELFSILIEKGANLSHKNNKHETALDIAFSTEHNSAVGVLLRAACQQNIPVKDVMSPKTRDRLRKYAFAHPPEIVKYLKNHAPDVGLFTPAAFDEGFPAYPTQTGNETKINLKS